MRKKTVSLLIITLLALTFYPLVPSIKAQTGPTVSLSPASYQVTQLQQTFMINVTVANVQNLWSWTGQITWDPTVLNLVNNPTEGSFLKQAGSTLFIPTPLRNATGETINDALESYTGASGSGPLATIEFQVIAQSASTTVQLSNITLEGPPPSGSLYGTSIPLASSSSTSTISFISGGAPAANAGSPQTVAQGSTVTFDGSITISTGTSPSYAWSFMYDGANKTLTGVNPTFTFNIPGIYVVTLIVTDSNGASTPAKVTITVQSNSKPVAVIAVEGISKGQSVPAGQAVIFNGTGSSEANNGTIVRYLWNAGEISQTSTSGKTISVAGGSTTVGTNATLKYTFSLPPDLQSAVYNVTLTVFDATNQNNTASTQITVTPGTNPSLTSTTPSSTATPTPSPTSTAATTSSTSTPTPDVSSTQAGLPSYVVVITVLITIMALAGSTIWLRKRT